MIVGKRKKAYEQAMPLRRLPTAPCETGSLFSALPCWNAKTKNITGRDRQHEPCRIFPYRNGKEYNKEEKPIQMAAALQGLDTGIDGKHEEKHGWHIPQA